MAATSRVFTVTTPAGAVVAVTLSFDSVTLAISGVSATNGGTVPATVTHTSTSGQTRTYTLAVGQTVSTTAKTLNRIGINTVRDFTTALGL